MSSVSQPGVSQGDAQRATKSSGVRRAADLRGEIDLLVKERNRIRKELDEFRSEHVRVVEFKELEQECRRLKKAEEMRLANESRILEGFVQRCAAARLRYPDFDDCVKAIGTIPTSWTHVIAALPNGAEFIVLLGRSPEFRTYLHELKEAAALERIQRAAFELRQHTQNQGGV